MTECCLAHRRLVRDVAASGFASEFADSVVALLQHFVDNLVATADACLIRVRQGGKFVSVERENKHSNHGVCTPRANFGGHLDIVCCR